MVKGILKQTEGDAEYPYRIAGDFLHLLGWALLAPGRLPRGEALRLAAIRAVRLLGGAALFLLIAAFIEAYWSSMTFSTPTVKYWVGAGLWALVLAYLCLAGRRHHAPD